MRFDFSQIQDVESFVSIPEGIYPCRVADAREGVNRDGSVRWSLRLEVAEGEYAGRTAGWDSLSWSDRGIVRVKRVLDVLGFDVRGEVEVEARQLIGAQARVEFRSEQWSDPVTGRQVLRLSVPYAGYEELEDGSGRATQPEDHPREEDDPELGEAISA